MFATPLLKLMCGLALVSRAFAQPTNTDGVTSQSTDAAVKQSQNMGKKTTSRAVNTETFQTSPNDILQSLSNIRIESADDVDKLINEIEKTADDIYNSEMANIQVWSQDQVLAPFQSQAEEGLTIARDRLKESAQKLRTKATEAIENAKANMSPKEFTQYMQELQQVIEVELAPTRQYFMDAAEAITQVSKETASKVAANASRAPKSQKKNSNAQNKASQVTNVPISAAV